MLMPLAMAAMFPTIDMRPVYDGFREGFTRRTAEPDGCAVEPARNQRGWHGIRRFPGGCRAERQLLWPLILTLRSRLLLVLWRCLALRGRPWALGLRLRRRLALWRRLRTLGLRLRRCLALGHRLRPLGLRLWRYLTLRRWVLWQGLLMLRHGLLRHGTSGGWLLSALLLRAHRRLLTTRLLRVDHWLSAPLLLRASRLWWPDGPHPNRGRWADIMIGLKRAALGHNSRTPPIDSREVIAIGLRGLYEPHLGRHRRCVLLAYRNEFRRAWPYRKPARAAVITPAGVDIGDVGGVVDDLVVINVVH